MHRISRHYQTGTAMISSSTANSAPVGLKVPELESSATSGPTSPELKMAAPATPPSLKMRRSHFSSQRADKIPTLEDINSISRRLFPMRSSQGEHDEGDDDAMSIDDVLEDALVVSPLHHRPAPAGGDEHKLVPGPPFPRPPSSLKIGTDLCWQKTIPHHVTPPTSSHASSSSLNVDQANLHSATGAAPSSSCSTSFIGGTANSAFAANNYHGAAPRKGKV